MKLDTYFPWVYRLAWILEWFYRIMLEQMGSRASVMFPPMLWPGWDWAQMNAIYSSRSAPWHFSWLLSVEIEETDEP